MTLLFNDEKQCTCIKTTCQILIAKNLFQSFFLKYLLIIILFLFNHIALDINKKVKKKIPFKSFQNINFEFSKNKTSRKIHIF